MAPARHGQRVGAALSDDRFAAGCRLAGAAAELKTPAGQSVALAKGTTLADRVLDCLDLMSVWEVDLRRGARRELARKLRIGKIDGIVSIEVDDESPQRAADMANQYVEESRELTNRLVSPKQPSWQRRAFIAAALLLMVYVLAAHFMHQPGARRLGRLRDALGRR